MFEYITDAAIGKFVKPWVDILNKLHIHIRSKCCDCFEVEVDVDSGED